MTAALYLGHSCQLVLQLCCSILLLVELHLQVRQVLFGLSVLSCQMLTLRVEEALPCGELVQC